MDRVTGEEQPSNNGCPVAHTAKTGAEIRVEERHCSVEKDIHHMKPGSPHAVEQTVPAES